MKMKFCKIALLLGVMATSQGVIAQTAAEDYKITLSGTAQTAIAMHAFFGLLSVLKHFLKECLGVYFQAKSIETTC